MFSFLLPAILLSHLANASPVAQRRTSTAIPLSRRHGGLSRRDVYDHHAKNEEVQRLKRRYAHLLDPEPPSLQERGGSSGFEALRNVNDSLWYGPVSFGTPPQTITINFDTGSSDIVIPTTVCSNCTRPLFNTELSSTYKASTTPANITYGDQSGAAGVISTDTVSVAGLTVQNQAFIAADFESTGFSDPNAGIMGLAFPSIAKTGADPFFVNLVKEGGLEIDAFSMYLSRNGSDGSELCLGCINPAKYTRDITYYPVDTSIFPNGTARIWNIASKGILTRGVLTSGFPAVIDSGTNVILLPTALAQQLYANVPGSVANKTADGNIHYSVPCATLSSTPIEIVFGETAYTINPFDLNGGPISEGSDMCDSAIVGSDGSAPLAIVGDAFMKNWYSVFDYGNLAVGFAKAI